MIFQDKCKVKVLDLFCGRGGWSKPFINAGHECTGIDIKDYGYPAKFIQADIFDWQPKEHYDFVLASPPCAEFSEVKRNCAIPFDERIGLDLIWRTFYLIRKIKPYYWVIENVKGLSEFIGEPKQIIKYGKSRKKAYLYGNFPDLGFFDSDFSDYGRDKLYHGKMSGWEIHKKGLRGEIPKALANQMCERMLFA